VCHRTTGTTVDSNTAEVYDPDKGTSTTVTSTLAIKRCMHTAVMAGNKVYVMGGGNDGTAANTLLIDVYLYNPATPNVFGAWQTTARPVLKIARTGHSATLLGAASNNGTVNNTGKIIVAGGYDTAHANGLDSFELFDPAGSSGNGSSALYTGTGSTFLAGRGEHAAALAGKWLLIIGGFDPFVPNYSPSVDAIDTTKAVTDNNPINPTNAATMTGFPNPAVARIAHSAIALSTTSILVVGGVPDGTGAVLASMQKYTLGTNGSITDVSAAANLAMGRARFQLLPAGPAGKYIVFGGSSAVSTTSASDTATSSIEVIDSGTLGVTSGGTLLSARQALSAVNLALTGASNFGFLVAGGAAASGGAEVVVGP
jgi:hypothetical protein